MEDIYINIYGEKSSDTILESFEEIVKQLVAYSMPLNFHIEALKCQSIIMRTNLVRQIEKYKTQRLNREKNTYINIENFKDTVLSEKYKHICKEDYELYATKLQKAVDETAKNILLFNNKPIDARFHLACGGSTENSENVDGNVIQYLRKVLCNYCEESPYFLNYEDISIEELEKKLDIKLTNDEVLNDIPIHNVIDNVIRDDQNRVVKIKIGKKEFKGKEIIDILNINSTRFSWQPQIIRFFTMGKGDGLGLCQHGANIMAEGGILAEEILKHYYTGVEIKTIKSPCINKPLKGKLIVIDPGHGGENDDYVGKQGLREKDVNLSISLYLKEELQDLGAKVYLTRNKDKTVTLASRAQVANSIMPHFFISIHQNHFSHPSKSGTEIYYFRGDTTAKQLAKEIMKAVTKELKTLDKGVKPADFFLLRTVNTSTLHVELAYISNANEEKKLMDEGFRRKAAKSIVKGIINFYRYV